jgi:hypothetical protein
VLIFVNIILSFRVVGAGGIILDPNGNIEFDFTWSLGHISKNQAKAYTLLLGV